MAVRGSSAAQLPAEGEEERPGGRREWEAAGSAGLGSGFGSALGAPAEKCLVVFFPSKSNGWRRSITRLLSGSVPGFSLASWDS